MDSDTKYSVWPDEIEPDIQPPRRVLRETLAGLEDKTKGILQGSFKTLTIDGKQRHVFSIIVPNLRNFEQDFITVEHRSENYYPCYVATTFESEIDNDRADSDRTLKKLLRELVTEPAAKSLLSSLIARANEEALEETRQN